MCPKFCDHKEKPRMISADEAREISAKSQFYNSEYAILACSKIRERALKGKLDATIEIPAKILDNMGKFLAENGYKCVATTVGSCAIVQILW